MVDEQVAVEHGTVSHTITSRWHALVQTPGA